MILTNMWRFMFYKESYHSVRIIVVNSLVDQTVCDRNGFSSSGEYRRNIRLTLINSVHKIISVNILLLLFKNYILVKMH